MTELLHLLYEYRHLVNRRKQSHGVLGSAADERLRGLDNLFGQEPREDGAVTAEARRRHARVDTAIAAMLQVGRRTEPIEIVNIGGGGVRLARVPNLPAGRRTILHIPNPTGAGEYHFPVQVGWLGRDEGTPVMGLPFVGRPSQVWGTN